MKRVAAVLIFAFLILAPIQVFGGKLDDVKARGVLRCGVSGTLPGFAALNSRGADGPLRQGPGSAKHVRPNRLIRPEYRPFPGMGRVGDPCGGELWGNLPKEFRPGNPVVC